MPAHSETVTRAADLLRAAGVRVWSMPSKRIDRDEFDMIGDELSNRQEVRDGAAVVITGNHEDHGRVTLRREAGVFTVEAESLEFVRPWGTAMEPSDE